jgi:hypothetical protein
VVEECKERNEKEVYKGEKVAGGRDIYKGKEVER